MARIRYPLARHVDYPEEHTAARRRPRVRPWTLLATILAWLTVVHGATAASPRPPEGRARLARVTGSSRTPSPNPREGPEARPGASFTPSTAAPAPRRAAPRTPPAAVGGPGITSPHLGALGMGMGLVADPIGAAPLANKFAPMPAPAQPRGDATTSKSSDEARERRPVLLRRRAVPPFWFERTYDTHKTQALVFPPLYLHRTGAKGFPEKNLHIDLALTFGWYSPKTQQRRWLSLPALFYGGYSERKTVWGAVPLLMGYRRVGEQFNFAQFPLVWWWGTRHVKNFLVLPFHYQQKAPDGFRGVSALLFWYGHKHTDDANVDNDRRHFVAAPLFYRFIRGQRRFDFAFVYMGASNKAKGKRWFAVTPFALWHEDEFGNRRELWTWGWVRRSDRARGRESWAVPLALTVHHADRDRRLLMATPLFWRTQNHLKGSTFTLAGGIFGRYTDPRQRNTFVAPLWWQFRDLEHNTTTSLLLPLAVARRTPTRRGVWTILGGGMRSAKGFGAAFPPLLSYVGRRDDGTRIQAILGLFWHLRKPGDASQARHTTVLAPLGFWDRRPERLRAGIPPLLLFAGRKGTTRWQVVTPLFWHAHDPTTGRRTVVAGPLYHHRRGEGTDGGVAPLVFYGSNRNYRYTVAPLLLFGDVTDVQAGRRLTLSPWFVRHKDRDGRTLGVLGLGWDVVRQGGAERHTAVVPFFYRRRLGSDRLVISPIGGLLRKGPNTTAVFGPYVQRRTPNRTVHGVLPLIWAAREETPEGPIRSVVAAPLYFHRNGPQDRLQMLTPLVWRRTIGGEHGRRNLAVVPFYFRQRQPGGVDVDGGPGFFYSRDAHRRTHTLMAGPFFHRLSRKALHTGVVPLWWWMDAEKNRRLVALPAIVHVADKATGEHTTVALPFWFDRKRPDGTRTWTAFPFVVGVKRLHNFTRVSVLPPGFVDVFRLGRNRRITGFMPFVFRIQKCGFRVEDDPRCAYKLWAVPPFFLYGKDGLGRVTHGSLLYVYDKRPEGMRLMTPLFGVRHEPGKVLSWYAGPIAVKTTNTHRRVLAFPLYFRRAHRLEKRSLTLVAPPLFIGRQREDRSFFEAGLIVWQTRRPHKVATAVLPPIFYHSHTYEQRKLTWFVPLFLRDNNIAKDETWTAVGPAAFVYRRHGDQRDFVQFPLVWHIERGENQGTFGAFAWWDIRARGRTFQMVPGAYFRFQSPRQDTRVVGPGLGWWTRGRGSTAGDFHWRALFGIFGGGIEEGRRYIALFGGRIDRGPGSAPKPRTAQEARRKKARLARQRARAARQEARAARQQARQQARAARQQARAASPGSSGS